jgi:hypothetical protein
MKCETHRETRQRKNLRVLVGTLPVKLWHIAVDAEYKLVASQSTGS